MNTSLTFKTMLFSLCLLMSALASSQSFQATLDRSTIELGDTVNLSFTYTDNAQQESPNFNVLHNNFDILSYYPSYSEINNNGKMTKLSSWEFVLEPKSLGKILIPPISFMGTHSNAIELTVNKPSANPTAGKDIFLETIVDKSSAYVQEQITVTYRLYYTQQIEVDPETPQINDTVIKSLDTKQYQRRIDGKLYRVAEVPFVLFPQRSGALVIPQTTWQIRVATAGARQSLFGNFGRYELRKLKSKEKIVRIKPIPDTFPKGATWLPAHSLKAQESWSKNTLDQLVIGEPITRTIKIEGQGVESAQIPVFLSDTQSDTLKTYLEPAQLNDESNQFGILGSRTESAAVVLEQAGEHQTKEISIPWWNTATDTLEKVVIPAHTLKAEDAPYSQNPPSRATLPPINTGSGLADAEPSSTQIAPLPASTNKLKWLIYILVATNIGSLGLIFYLVTQGRKHTPIRSAPTASTRNFARKAPFLELKQAVQSGSASATYEAVQRIARELFKVNGLSELKQLANQKEFESLSKTLESIERKLYLDNTETENLELSLLEADLKQLLSTTKQPSKENLEPLY